MVTEDETGDEAEKVIKENPKHLKCTICGHEEDIYAATAIPEGDGKYSLIFGSDADFCTQCDEPWGRNAEQPRNAEQAGASISDYSQEDIDAAIKRYPGIPLPLAMVRYTLDKQLFGSNIGDLQPGMGWGGIHLEAVGVLVQKLAETMYRQIKKEITILIRCEDFPESYDHLWVEIKDVGEGSEEEKDRFPYTKWPCCACGTPVPPGDAQACLIVLHKKATWQYPTWGIVSSSSGLRACSVLCGKCRDAGKQPDHAIKKDGGLFELVPISDLEDYNETSKNGE